MTNLQVIATNAAISVSEKTAGDLSVILSLPALEGSTWFFKAFALDELPVPDDD